MPPKHHVQRMREHTGDPVILGIALSAAVPLWIQDFRRMTPDQRAARARGCALVISAGERFDELRGQHGCGPALVACGELARGRNEGGPAAVFNAIAQGLAIASFQPGGVHYAGHHWESKP